MSDLPGPSTAGDSDSGLQSGLEVLEPPSRRALVVFQISERVVAFPLEDVERIIPMVELGRPPGLPAVLEGVLNLASVAIPVLRLDRLFGLPRQQLSLYSMLIILRVQQGVQREARLAILVDRVREVLPVAEDALLPLDRDDSLNGCAVAAAAVRDEIVQVLSPERILLGKERDAFADFQKMAQRRLQDWAVGEA